VRRVLFVDDDPLVLDGLRDMLRSQRLRWGMRFTADPHAAKRIVLSGHLRDWRPRDSDRAHLVLAKPCDVTTLMSAIQELTAPPHPAAG